MSINDWERVNNWSPFVLDFTLIKWLDNFVSVTDSHNTKLRLKSLDKDDKIVLCFTPGRLNIWKMSNVYHCAKWEINDWDTRFFSKTSWNKTSSIDRDSLEVYLDQNLQLSKWERQQIIVRKTWEDTFEFYTAKKDNTSVDDTSTRQACMNTSWQIVQIFDNS